ncbi:MMPL family transporter [Streptomyces sp. ST2-7A]|uniref:MMPL family transporter n=1 Tax=Streptomyces sp. ST2-7A TaxID=2907214 RepID=UPI001F185B87|nr:MMPL family transporter [Streptomyces sp. ST2-7A]MCE7079495.1 MMPL family transporter [Streptomyces sp. ST2-7A]
MRTWLSRCTAVPGSRRGKWLVLVAWLIAAMALGPLAGKLGEVSDTSANAFLPRGAESAEVNTQLERFRADDLMSAVVVYVGEDPLGEEARAKVETDRGALAALAEEGHSVSETIPSDDGLALVVVVPLSGTDQALLAERVEEIRDVVSAGNPSGVEALVGGAGGATADAYNVFESLDITLMSITALVVVLLLLFTYRSPVLWLFPVIAVAFAAVLTQAGAYLLAEYAGLQVDPQSSGVLMVLVFGVGTDYALLLISRYREELRAEEDRHVAMRSALRRTLPAVVASAATVAAGLLCLAMADMNSSRSMGLVGVVGIAFGFLAMVTVLPALLVVAGRWVFWPRIPRFTDTPTASVGRWERIGNAVAARPRRAWVLSLAAVAVLAMNMFGASMGLPQTGWFQTPPESVHAQERLSEHYPSGTSDPTILITDTADAEQVARQAEALPGVASVETAAVTPDGESTQLTVVLSDAPDSKEAMDTIRELRDTTDALVGGNTAQALDKETAFARDLMVVVPAVLIVVLLVLIVLLRALVAPLLLLATVVISYFAAFGAANLLFTHVYDHAGIDWSMPLLGFVFLVALGIDYNIFLMHRVREETLRLGHRRGVVAGLAGTGGVITSAGLVLAGTFAVFAVLPLVSMAQMGVIVGIGILIDTFLVRTVLVPALALDLGAKRFWWPGALARDSDEGTDREEDTPRTDTSREQVVV